MFCKNCGQALEDSARFCTACGTAVERPVCETAENPAAPTAPAGAHAPFPAKYPAVPPQAQPPAGMAPEGAAGPTAKKKKTGVIFLCAGLVLVILAAAFAGIWVWKGTPDNTPVSPAAGTPDSSAASATTPPTKTAAAAETVSPEELTLAAKLPEEFYLEMTVLENGEPTYFKVGEKDDKLYLAMGDTEILVIEDENDVTLETYARQSGTDAFVKTENITDDEKYELAQGLVAGLIPYAEVAKYDVTFELAGTAMQAGRPCHIYTATDMSGTVAFYIDDATKCCLKSEIIDTQELPLEVTVFQESGFTLPERP